MFNHPPDFCVIIPHYNDPVRLDRCLAALTPQVEEMTDIDIVVVDNNSTKPPKTVITSHKPARMVREVTPGAAAARNAGVAATTAPMLLFLDADCVPAPDWLARARTMARPGTIVGGRIDLFDETPPPRSGAEAFERVFAFNQQTYIEKKGFLVTASLIVPRTVYDSVGPFRSGVSEDLDWCRRATTQGYTLIYDDSLTVGHPSRSDWAALKHKWRRLTVETFALTPKNGTSRILWAVRAILMPVSACAHLPRVLTHKALTPKERLRGSATLFRLRLQRMIWMLRQALTGTLVGL